MSEAHSKSGERRPTRKHLSTSAIAALCLLAGSALGLLVVPRASAPSEEVGPAPPVSLLGTPLSDAAPLETAQEVLTRYLARTLTLKLPDAPSVSLSLSQLGADVDEARLQQLLRDARDPSSPTRRLWAQEAAVDTSSEEATPPKALPLPLTLSEEALTKRLLQVKDEFDRRPQSARLDLEKKSVVPHVDGRYLDLDSTLVKIKRSLLSGELTAEAAVHLEKPEREAEDLKGLQVDHVLGHFETKYSRARKYEDRTYNLALAASKLNGTVLMPGESFDFNDVVGARDEANGYKVATVIANGELVDGIGGGTCQVSGTLHGAAFFAGLDIIERYPHTRPSSYIKMGMDATVVYPTINFRFRNPYDFPIALRQVVSGGTVRAEILGPRLDQVVTLIRRVDEALPYEQLQKKDPKLPRGTRILAQRGIPGFRLHRYRTIRRGSHTVREKWRDVYPPTPQVIRIGTGETSLRKRRDVGTPEYKADEVLILTLRRPEGTKPGVFAENREPGKFGKNEWTREAGMPFWEGQ